MYTIRSTKILGMIRGASIQYSGIDLEKIPIYTWTIILFLVSFRRSSWTSSRYFTTKDRPDVWWYPDRESKVNNFPMATIMNCRAFLLSKPHFVERVLEVAWIKYSIFLRLNSYVYSCVFVRMIYVKSNSRCTLNNIEQHSAWKFWTRISL